MTLSLEIEQSHLQTLLASVIGAVKSRQTIPILGNVKITATDTLQAVATDLDLEVTAKKPAQVATQGSTTVNAQMLSGIVSKLPKGSMVSLSIQGDYLHIQSGRSKFNLATLPVEDFPEMASDEYEARLDFNGLDLKAALSKTVWAASTEETRYYLKGVAMQRRDGKANFIATDGHRLAWFTDGHVDEFPDVIIPNEAVKQFIGALSEGDAVLEVSETKIRLTHGDVVIVTKSVDGRFPDWTRVIPKDHANKVTMSSVDAKAAIERVSVVATERTKAVRLSIAEGEVTLYVSDHTGGDATEALIAAKQGDDVTIGLNSKYALDVLAQADKGDITIHYGGSMDKLLVKYDKEPNLTGIAMPLRI